MILHLTDSRTRGLVVVATLLIGLWLTFFGLQRQSRVMGTKESRKKG